jgi:hypothetical protein
VRTDRTNSSSVLEQVGGHIGEDDAALRADAAEGGEGEEAAPAPDVQDDVSWLDGAVGENPFPDRGESSQGGVSLLLAAGATPVEEPTGPTVQVGVSHRCSSSGR